jgi:hypothetical protein
LFDSKECISITWDKDKRVFGISLKSDANNNHITGQAFCDNEEYSFAERLKYVNDKLYTNQDQFIIIGGYLSSAVCLEVTTPPLSGKDIAQYLYYELARQIPYPVGELKWCYRSFTQKENKTEQNIRIFAVFEKEWNELLSEIIASGIKVDSFVYPFMVINPLFQNSDITLTDIDNEFFFCPPTEIEDGYMKKISTSITGKKSAAEKNGLILEYFKDKYEELTSEPLEKSLPALILAEYCLTREYFKDKKNNIKIPNELQPKRFKSLKITAIILLILFIIFSSSYVIRQRIDTIKALDTLTDEKTLILNTIKKINFEYQKNQKYEKMINEIKETTPKTIDPIKYLDVLTKAIPGNIWMTSFASNKDKVNVTLQTKSDAGSVISDLNKSQLFRTENVRKRKTSGGVQYIYLTLKPKI